MRKFAWITLITGLLLSAVAGFYSVIGLAMIFSGAFVPVVVLAGLLEVSKLVAVSWLYRYRSLAGRWVRLYFYTATLILMCVTSMGIFGYLTRAHVESEGTYTTAQLTLQEIQQRETNVREQRDRINTELNILNTQSSQLLTQLGSAQRLRGTQGAVAVQRDTTARRATLLSELQQTTAALTAIQQERIGTEAETQKATADIGPLRYVAQAFYGNDDVTTIRRSVVALTIIVMMVFDPMAIMLLIAANILFVRLSHAEPSHNTPVADVISPTIPPVAPPDRYEGNITDVPFSLL